MLIKLSFEIENPQKYVAVAYSILAINEAYVLRETSLDVFSQDHISIDIIAAPYSSRFYR